MLYKSLRGHTGSDLYEAYLKFYKYAKYFIKNDENIYAYLEKNLDQSIVNKYILCSIRLKEFLNKLLDGTYLKLDIPITY